MKKYKYTFISLLFAALFIVGSMAVTNTILRRKETKLLTERGKIEMESPVWEWNGAGSDDEDMVTENNDGKEYSLTMKQIEEAVKSWNNRAGITLHDRVAGQISMEKAIENGKEWLKEMAVDRKADKTSFSINAELGIGGQKKDTGERREAYLSFWTVTYSNRSMNVILYLNAVTGNVWGAEIKLYKERSKELLDDRLHLFVKLAGLQAADDVSSAIIDSEDTKSTIMIKESQLYAQEQWYSMASSDYGTSYEYIVYQLQ